MARTKSYGLIVTIFDEGGDILAPIIACTKTHEKLLYLEDGKDRGGNALKAEEVIRKKVNKRFGQGAYGTLKSGSRELSKMAHTTNTFGRIASYFHIHTTRQAWESSLAGAPGSTRCRLVKLEELGPHTVPCHQERFMLEVALKNAHGKSPQLAQSA